jgi:uncharacterized membrane-anchored protein
MPMRRLLFIIATLAVFAVPNWAILGKERLLREGRTVLVDLGPVDPRSLIQGDYMRLRYVLPEPIRRVINDGPIDGKIVITLDENGVAVMQRIFTDVEELKEKEMLLSYRRRRFNQAYFGARSFFFQEGKAHLYNGARYGELVVNEKGDSMLVGLRDAEFRKLGQKK